MTELTLKILLAYLAGSVSGSLLLGKLRGVDIRTSGSGNAGGTNALRTQGWLFALGVVVIDIGKGAIATGPIAALSIPGLAGSSSAVGPLIVQSCCGLAAILGHIYPIYYGFRGGKGAATFIGALLLIQPMAVLWVFLVWLGMLIASGVVGLATMFAAVFYLPLAMYSYGGFQGGAWFAAGSAILIVYAHRSNLARLLRGNENQFRKITLAYWLTSRRK